MYGDRVGEVPPLPLRANVLQNSYLKLLTVRFSGRSRVSNPGDYLLICRIYFTDFNSRSYPVLTKRRTIGSRERSLVYDNIP